MKASRIVPLLTVAAALLLAGVALAQHGPGHEFGFGGGHMLEFFSDYLDLTSAQRDQVKAIMEKSNASKEEDFKVRAAFIKEERADLVKHHLWVLWTDYFKPEHLEKYPQLHDLFWKATKTAGEAKKTTDVAVADRLLQGIAEIDRIFWETKKA